MAETKEIKKISKEKPKEEKKKKSLVEELRQKLSEEELNLENEEVVKSRLKEIKQDLSDKEIEELSSKISKEEVEEEKKSIKAEAETLIPIEDYIKCAVHLGTKVITPHMRKFVYKRRADCLAVINTIFMINYSPETIYIACKREAGWPAVRKFEEITNIRAFTKKYPPGVTTNLELEDFFESELTLICDPWIDKNPLFDTARLKKPVISLCDTNNFTTHVTKIIPCNNKSGKSIGCILYIIAREYCKAKKIPFKAKLEDFTGPLE